MSEFIRNEIAFDELCDRIDGSIEDKSNIMVVCNYELAKEISEYLEDEHNMICENTSLFEEGLDEYYVSLYFDEDEIRFYCECARGNSGEFKLCPDDNVVDYYIFLEMTDEEIKEKLCGEGSWGLYDLIEDEDEDKEKETVINNFTFNITFKPSDTIDLKNMAEVIRRTVMSNVMNR